MISTPVENGRAGSIPAGDPLFRASIQRRDIKWYVYAAKNAVANASV